MKKLVLITVLCVLTQVVNAQMVQKFGKIDKNSADISNYSIDTSASAVVLFSVGEVEYNSKLEIQLKVHNRIKILNENGYDFGSVVLVMPESRSIMKINKIEGITWVEESNGKFKKHKLNKKDIFTQNASDDVEHVKFTMPNLEPGAIIEYQYVIDIKNYHYFPSWQFQWDIPVLYTEFFTQIPEYFSYGIDFKGYVPLSEHKTDRKTIKKSIQYSVGPVSSTRFGTVNMDINTAKYAMSNVPAFKSEPFITTSSDYRSKMDFYLNMVKWPDEAPIILYESWPKTGDKILERDSYKNLFGIDKKHLEIAADITQSEATAEQKAKDLYDYVVKNYEWNNYIGLSPDKSLKKLLNDKSGNGASLNLFLVDLCKAAGLNAYPVAISTRANGRINYDIASASQFNHVLAAVEVQPEQIIFMDAKNKYRAYDLLAVNDLAKMGLKLLPNSNSNWVYLENLKTKSNESMMLEMSLLNDGVISGKFSYTTTGYNSVSIRELFDEVNDTTSINDIVKKKWFSGLDEISIDSITTQNLDNAYVEPIISAYFNVPNQTITTDSTIYFNPLLIGRYKRNPLKLNERQYPVDFIYPSFDKLMVKLMVPEGYEVDELPKPMQMSLPSRSATFRLISQQQPDGLVILSDVRITKSEFLSTDYQAIREFFQQLVDAQDLMIVLKKKEK